MLADIPGIYHVQDISPDGKVALYTSIDHGARALFAIRLDGQQRSQPTLVAQTGEAIYNGRFSPDGRWIVYNVVPGIFVQPFPGPGLRRQLSSGGEYPVCAKTVKRSYISTGNRTKFRRSP